MLKDPADHRTRQAGLKRWSDEAGRVYVTLYTAERIYRWQSVEPLDYTLRPQWEPRTDTVAELVAVLGKKYGRSEIEQIVARFDVDGDKQLNYDEFLMAWTASGKR